MSVRAYEVPNLGIIHVHKRQGSKQLRLTVSGEGKIRVTIPAWAPFKAGVVFAQQKQQWLLQQKNLKTKILIDNQAVGKYQRLFLRPVQGLEKIKTRSTGTELVLSYPATMLPTAENIQLAAQKLAHKGLKAQAEQLLPQRLNDLSGQFRLQYRSVTARHLKSRWGSCNSRHELTFNYFLMLLPWDLIDYVIVHELAHTKELNHSPIFWQTVEAMLPDYKLRRKALKQYQPSVISISQND